MDYDLFWKKIQVGAEDDCWPWKGSTHQGYGVYYVDNYAGVRRKKKLRAHRVAWLSTFGGGIPDGKILCHTCDNPLCCNPNHMYLGTDQDNYDDAIERSRNPRGARKLTEQQVREIRASSEGDRALSARYGVRPWAIRQIRKFETYKWVVS